MRIAVVIPNYNSAKTIEDTLQSIKALNKLDLVTKVYLADDGSTDTSIQQAQSIFSDLYVLLNKPNIGQWKNLNRALQHIRSEGFDWVLVLHADDVVKPHWLELMVEQIENASTHVVSVCSSWDDWLPDGSIITGEDNSQRHVNLIKGTQEAVRNTIHRGCWWHISGAAIRLSVLETIGLFDPIYSHNSDYEYLLRILNSQLEVIYIPRTLLLYRYHDLSVSSHSFRYNLSLIHI